MKKFFFAVIFAAIFFICTVCSAYAPEGKLYVTMLENGQGDTILIETPTQNILLDTGDTDNRRHLVAKLKAAGIERFEKIILTHPHSDHIGGVGAILKNFPVDEIIDNGVVSNSPLYSEYHEFSTKFSSVVEGDKIDFGLGIKFTVFNPAADVVQRVNDGLQKSTPNDESIVGKLTYGDFSMLFTGDITRKCEERLYKKYHFGLKSVILKSPHHGSRTSSSEDFIEFVSPNYVFISAGRANKFGHPHKTPLATYRRLFVLPENIFCTRFNGDIRVESDGKNHRIILEHYNDWVEEYTGERIIVTRLL